jgi:hypothetical protein
MTLNYENVSRLLQDKIQELEDRVTIGGRGEEFYALCADNVQNALNRLNDTVYNNRLNSDPSAQDMPDAEISNADNYLTQHDLHEAMEVLEHVEKMQYRRTVGENSLVIMGAIFIFGVIVGYAIGKNKKMPPVI